MPKTILFHSVRHGVGRSNLAANIACLLALEGYRVGIVDIEGDSPTLNFLFGLNGLELTCIFNDFLAGQCTARQVAHSLTKHLGQNVAGELLFIPNAIRHITAASPPAVQESTQLNNGCQELIDSLNLDMLIVDTQPGHSKQALVSLTLADALVIVLRHDWRDYQGTGVTVDIVKQLNIPQVMLILNEIPASFDFAEIKAELERNYNCEVGAVVPYVEELMALANQDIFVLRYPNHPVTACLKQAALKLA